MSVPPPVDTDKPSIARVYDALLGGKDNFEVDRQVAERLMADIPGVEVATRHLRKALGRIVRWLVREAGIDQFLDLGSGLPTAENVHQVAQRVNPDVVVVYVDNDPVVAAHGRVMLEENDHTHFVVGDLTKPDELLRDPVMTHLDFTRPLGLIQSATLHFVADQAVAEHIMRAYVDRLASGSYVVMAHGRAAEEDDELRGQAADAFATYRERVTAGGGFTLRTREQVEALLPALELIEPGLVAVDDWWPDGPPVGDPPPGARFGLVGVARKP
jgi:SAM-dependent methyltransferase